jgi:glycerophosphoryl diester phosphodiesterase
VPENPGAIELVAHRGNALEFPENTLPAFESAVSLGCRWLECDVQLAADRTPFVVHDADLQRVAGVAANVLHASGPVIDTVEPIERGRFGERFTGTRIPRLAALAEWLETRPGPQLFVELKRASLMHHGRPQCLDAVGTALERVRDRCIVISFDPEVLPLARLQGFRIGWVLQRYDDAALARLAALEPEFAFCDHTRLPAAGPLAAGAWQWVLYEVRSADLARDLRARGARFMETMAVAQLARELAPGTART